MPDQIRRTPPPAVPIELITAPSNLGLRPPAPGREPGAWRGPAALLAAGLAQRLRPVRLTETARPPYDPDAQPGTRIFNGITLRAHALELAGIVEASLLAGRFAFVVGGDCSILLGCLLGARYGGRIGLLHVDGHHDFFHPGNYDTGTRLGSAAGMDLALATGRGELLLTHWPRVGMPLVADGDAIQIGTRDGEMLSSGPPGEPALEPSIRRISVQDILVRGVAAALEDVRTHVERDGLERLWLHVDIDVLDATVMPAVDTPGSPGLDFAQLAELLANLVGTGRVLGMDLTIYDPELDPGGEHAPTIVNCIASAFPPIHSRAREGREEHA